MNSRIISQNVAGVKRTFVSEDIKHILDQLDNILYIQRKMVDTMLIEKVNYIVDPDKLDIKDLNGLKL